jgi:hypothetical protein
LALNLHRLLHGTAALIGFRGNIHLSDEDEVVLREARDAVRQELKAKFRAISDAEPLAKAFIVEGSLRYRFGDAELRGLRLTPKFRSQGSYVYGTLNDPVPDHVPPQQVDLDDGVFVPTSFVNQERPVIAAKAYFEAVEGALEGLCTRRGWRLCKEKSSCVRIYVGEKIHIDLPLYAIPDGDFAQVEMMAKASGARTDAMDSAVLLESEYQAVPDDHIMLAEREGTWRKSDPRALERWFVAAVKRHSEALRNVCRYLKAWRDNQWKEPKDGIPSITLMAIAVEVFDGAASLPPPSREDRALHMVAAAMPEALGRMIENPVVDGERLDGEWTQAKRSDFIARARTLAACLDGAMGGSSPDAAIVRMQDCLGERIPTQPSLVQPDEEANLLASPRLYVAAPAVGRSVSG